MKISFLWSLFTLISLKFFIFIYSNLIQLSNKLFILSTSEVTKLDKSNEVNEAHPLKVLRIVWNFEVSKLDKLIEANEEHPLNIAAIE